MNRPLWSRALWNVIIPWRRFPNWQTTWRNVQKLIPAAAGGQLTPAAYDAAVKNNPMLARILNLGSLDTDGDGTATREELSRANRPRLDATAKAVDERNDDFLWQYLGNLSSAYLLEDWNEPPTHVTLLKLDIPICENVPFVTSRSIET